MTSLDYEELKENLVENLTDIETIKAYLHRNDYSDLDLLKAGLKPFKKDRKLHISWFFHSLATGLIPVLNAFILYFLVDRLTNKGADAMTIIKISGIFALIFASLNIISAQLEYRVDVLFSRTRMNMLHTCLDNIMTMDYGLGENPNFINEAERFMNAFSSNNSGIEGVYREFYKTGGYLISLIVFGLILSYLSPLIFIFSILSLISYVWLKERIASYKHARMEKLNLYKRRSGRLADIGSDFKFGKDIRLYGFSDKFDHVFSQVLDDFVGYYKDFTKPQVTLSLPLGLSLLIGEGLGLYFLGRNIMKGQITLAQLSLFASSILLFMTQLEMLAENISTIKEEIKYFADGLDMMEADLVSLSGDKTLSDEENLEIVFDHVSFSYPGSDKNIFDDLSFKISKGQRLAVVGVNGAGKTTLAKLILGLYKPSSGKIYLNGIDAEELDLKGRFEAFSAVLQETEPLALSIAENVAGSLDNIDRQRVYESLARAGLKKKIDLLPKRIDTQMTKIIDEDGTIFSGGENQKLAIARALYKKDYKALILDEPTASLDALAEEKIYKDLDQIVGNKTLIFISHRLASTSFCDKILLLDGGKIVEFGSHEDLMQNNGLYKKMFMAQGKYYKE